MTVLLIILCVLGRFILHWRRASLSGYFGPTVFDSPGIFHTAAGNLLVLVIGVSACWGSAFLILIISGWEWVIPALLLGFVFQTPLMRYWYPRNRPTRELKLQNVGQVTEKQSTARANTEQRTTTSAPTENEYTAPKPASIARNHEAVRLLNEAAQLQNPEEALQKLDFALRCAPDFEEAWCAKANVLATLGKLEQAILCYDRAPSMFQAWCNRGIALRRLGRNEMALQSYDRALALNDRDKITWLNRGVVLEKLDRPNDALASYDTALAIDSNHAETWVNKADLLRRLKRPQEAFTCFDRGLSLNPEDCIGWTNRGRLLYEQKRWEEAATCFEKALRHNKRFEPAWMELGSCLGELDRFDEARACFKVVIELNQKNGTAWHNKGIAILNTHKDYVEASICFGQALRLGVKEAEFYLDMCEQRINEDNIT